MAKSALADFREIECVRWFRGFSEEQIKACDELLYALRDDTQQGTTYRVRQCFNQLGIYPPIPSERIKNIMNISQCNDLAFLWFTWEVEYKCPRDKSTNIDIDETFMVNEQLLYSAMAHLDMTATLRALDDILPPPSHSKKFMNKKNNSNVEKKEIRNQPQHRRKQKPNQYISPYFAPLMRPKLFEPKMTAMPKEKKLFFPQYSQYKNPMYEVPNERSRWFAQYKLSPGKRIIKKFLTEELNRLFFDNSSLFSKPNINRSSFCSTHKSMNEELALKQKELAYEALKKCMAHLDAVSSENEARRKRIRESLEREIQCAADKMRQLSRRQFTQLVLLRSDYIDADCRLCNYLVSSPAQKKGREADLSLLINSDFEQVGHPMPPDEENFRFVKVLQLRGEQQPQSLCKTDKLVDTETNEKVINQSNLIQRSLGGAVRKGSRQTKRVFKKKNESYILKRPTTDFKNLKDLIPVCGHWQKCVSSHHIDQQESYTTKSKVGFQYDYFKIFDPPNLQPLLESDTNCETGKFQMNIEDKQPLINHYCLDALNKTLKDHEEIEKWDNIEVPDCALPPQSLKSAVDKCAKNIFKTEMDIRGRMEGSFSNDRENLMKVTNIDPDNRNQLVELLKSGLKILRQDPSYVLATFCNAHKLPILVDWVADRYGKTFNQKEMTQIVKSSFQVYQHIERTRNLIEKLIPQGARGSASYADRERIIRKAQRIKKHFRREFSEKELEHSRLIWLALRGYSHLSGYNGDTFSAYMPSRETDLKFFNLWNSTDYRNMVLNRYKSTVI